MVVLFYLGGCTICGAVAAWFRARGLPFGDAAVAALVADEG